MQVGTLLAPGTVFAGEFRVERPLAQGGMGAVYVVEQLQTGQRRALKVMQPQLLPDERSRHRFLEEARIGSRIESEHVVQVVAAGIDAATAMPWLAMELLEGADLERYIAQFGPRPAPEVLQLFQQLGHAFGAAHRRGIIHRDLKPENLFVARSRRMGDEHILKILDFGIARTLAESGASATVTAAIGSPLWMAPEQAQTGAKLRPCTDVWPLGLIAFYVLTGKHYWVAANHRELNLSALLVEVMTLPIEPPTQRCRAVGANAALLPPNFDVWFAHCVTREMDERFADGGLATSALQAVLTNTTMPIPRARSLPPKVRSPGALIGMAGAVLAAMICLGGAGGSALYALSRPAPSAQAPPQLRVEAPSDRAEPPAVPPPPLIEVPSAPAGTLDPGFGAGGFVEIVAAPGEHRLQSIALARDGAIVGVGHVPVGGHARLTVTRVTAGGQLDAQFGDGGFSTIGENDTFASDLAIADDGSIYALGLSYRTGLVLGRLTSSGRLDPSFGVDGVVSGPGGRDHRPSAVLIAPSGEVLVVGSHTRAPEDILPGSQDDTDTFVMQFDAHGQLDERYASHGIAYVDATPDREFATRAALRPDGVLIATGYAPRSNSIFAVAVLADGRPSASFGTGGATSISSPPFSVAWASALGANGEVYIGGENADQHACVVRLRPDGMLDPTWGQNGIALSALDGSDQLYRMITQPDGRVMGVGFRGLAESADFFLTRFTTEGRLDPSFGGGSGYETRPMSTGADFAFGAALGPGGRTVLVGGDTGHSILIARFYL